MKKSLIKDSFKEITKTHKRFLSILLMAFLGVGFFAGVRATSPDMKLSIDSYYDNQKLYDINVISTLGLTDDDITSISKIDGVEKVCGIYSEDVYVSFKEEEAVVKIYVLNDEINNVEIIEGKLPENADECVLEDSVKTAENLNIGDYIEIRENLSEDEEATFKNTKLKIVGFVKSPLYISRDRGTTTLGSGKVTYYMYINKDNIESDIYTEIDLVVKDSKKLSTLDDEYTDLISSVEEKIENIKEERETARYNEVIDKANKELADAQNEFDTEKKDAEEKIADAEKEIENGKKEIRNGEKKIKDSEKELADGRVTANNEFANAENQINEAQNKLTNSQAELDKAKKEFEESKAKTEELKSQIQAGIETIDKTIASLTESKTAVETLIKTNQRLNELDEIIKNKETELQSDPDNEDLKKELENLYTEKATLEATKQYLEGLGISESQLSEIETGLNTCYSKKAEYEANLEQINSEIEKAEKEILENQNKINAGWGELSNSKAQLNQSKIDTEAKFKDAENQIESGKKEIAKSKKELEDGEKELEEKKIEFDEKIKDAESKLIDAREKINDIEEAKWYILDRYDNSGFNSYSQDTDNVKKLGEAFPIVFFIIATLVSLTSMSRMVEEQRVQIGTLKALGYNKFQIMMKYIIYSFSASIVGGFLGAVFGLNFFPRVIITMYLMLYNLNNIIVEFNVYYAILGIGIMSICIVGATIYTASKELKSAPAELMRPKAPKAGKRVLLEHIPFIWKRLKFTQKVTVRNMFRYKKRFLMTIIGIMGCTALIVTGFGLKDSISNIMEYQYVDIYHYDMLISLKNTLTTDEISSLITELEGKEEISKCVEVYMTSNNVKKENDEKEAQIIVTNDINKLEEVITLKDAKTGEKLNLNDEGIIITDKLSQLLNINIGDEIILSDSDENEYKVKVEGIAEHYISHYIYMTDSLYSKISNKDVSTNVLLAKYASNLAEEKEAELSKTLLSNSKISSVTRTNYLIEKINDTLSAMNLVVYILIISAGLLAFIVLYNLSNINISERIRELATIKVLGFYDKEVYDYVTREIVLLTIIGILIGLIFGFFLNSFILKTCEIEMLRFKRIITWQSYLISSLITIVFTYIVNFITFFSLKKIDMIESLKSVE